MPGDNKVLLAVEEFVTNFYRDQVPKEYVYHDLQHTQNVVLSCREMGLSFGINDREMELLIIAAWFHDTGYDKGPERHEERSCEYCGKFLIPYSLPEEELKTIFAIIMATKLPQKPEGLLQQIICDADLSHLGDKSYWDRCGRVRQELIITRNRIMTDQEWVDFELNFLTNHQYHTFIAKEHYNKRKLKHIVQLRKQKMRLNPGDVMSMEEMFELSKKKKKKEKAFQEVERDDSSENRKGSVGRGAETMYRTNYNTHINLSHMADQKANQMISINTIVIGVIFSSHVPPIIKEHLYLIPTILLISVCMTAIVFATLSTRPKITSGRVTIEDIKMKRSNLLFFGNYYNMKLEDYHWGVMEMIHDSDFLYSSMTRDLYYLGVVLAKKYRYLSICYNIFMYGMIFSVIAYAITFIISQGS